MRESRYVRPSFDCVFRAEVVPLRGYLYRRLGNADADDLAAETFAIAFRNWDKFDREKPVRPWLYGIATNLLRHHRRREQRMLRAYARSVSPTVSQDDCGIEPVDAEARRAALAAALAELRPAERDVLLLCAWAELSDGGIATALSAPIGTVKSRLHRARGHLRNRLAGDGQVEADMAIATLKETTDE